MNTDILTETNQTSKLWQTTEPAITLIRTFDKQGQWAIEVLFEGGNKVTGTATAEFVADLESDLADQGWQVDASLFCRGFNAKPPVEFEEFIFASSAGLWPDDLGLAEVTL